MPVLEIRPVPTTALVRLDPTALGSVANGAFTLLVVAKPMANSSLKQMLGFLAAGNSHVFGLYEDGTDRISLNSGTYYQGADVGKSIGDWQILAVTKASGTVLPRFHRKKVGEGSWSHVNTVVTKANESTTVAAIELGARTAAGPVITDGVYHRMAVAAIFDTALSDAEIESIDTTPATQTILDLDPAAAWELGTDSIVDLTASNADEVSRVGGASTTYGDNPPGWVYNTLDSDNDASTPVLRFDGDNDYIAGTAPGGLDGDFTIAVMLSRNSNANTDSMVSTRSSGQPAGLSFFQGSLVTLFNDNAGNQTSPVSDVPGPLSTYDLQTYIAVVTHGAGETPRFHQKNLTVVSTAWAHGDGVTAQTANPDPATLEVDIGAFNYGGSFFDHLNGDIGLVAWWDDIEMSDAQVEALSANFKTSDWHNHAVGPPTSLTELTTATPADLEELVTWTNNGAVLTGDLQFPLWEFDGTGAIPTLHFDGDNDYVGGVGQGAMNGTLTVAALVQRQSTDSYDAILSTLSSAAFGGFVVGIRPGDDVYSYIDNTGGERAPSSVDLVNNTTDWWIIAWTRTVGASTPRYHLKNVTIDGDWDHGNAGSADTGDPDSAAGGVVEIGRHNLGGSGTFSPFSGNIALVAWWDGIALDDTQVEALDAGTTSAWQGSTAGAPSSLTELTSLTPVDLQGLVTWTPSGATITADSPPWTFDGEVGDTTYNDSGSGNIIVSGTGDESYETATAYNDSRTGTIIASGSGDEEYIPPDTPVVTVGPLVITLVDDAGNTVDGTVEARLRGGGAFGAYIIEAGVGTIVFPFDSTDGVAIMWLEVGKYEWRATVGANTTDWLPVDVPGVS